MTLSTDTNFDALRDEVNRDPQARCAGRENAVRRVLAEQFNTERQARGWTVLDLADRAGVTEDQISRVLHLRIMGDLHLATIVKVADALGVNVTIKISSKEPT